LADAPPATSKQNPPGTLGIPLLGVVLSPDPIPVPSLDFEHIAALRSHGGSVLSVLSAPAEAEELWRYSGIDQFDPVTFQSSNDPTDVASCLVDLPESARSAGVTISGDPDAPTDPDYFAALGLANAATRLVVRIPANVELTDPIRITTTLRASGTAGTSVRVVVGENSGATVIEEFRSDTTDRPPSLLVATTDLDLGVGARLRHASVQLVSEHDWFVGSLVASTAADASLASVAVALGGAYARFETTARATARGAHNELLAVYFAAGDQVHDFRTRQDHIAPRTTSDLLFKGAVDDRARSVYSGLIHIGKDARGTVAHQTNRNLLLSPESSAESVPNLEIENNDVKCSHASAVGPIDDEHRYYLESRGVPPSEAERLIVLGFFADLLNRVPDDALRAELVAAVIDKFDRRTLARGGAA
jgi:Fe-S cluster assembly protein SufD